jgi:hypothetical protein
VTQIEALAHKMSSVMLDQGSRNSELIQEINQEVSTMAMQESGCSAYDLQDEAREDSPLVQLYWMTNSMLMAKVMMTCASQLYRSETGDK